MFSYKIFIVWLFTFKVAIHLELLWCEVGITIHLLPSQGIFILTHKRVEYTYGQYFKEEHYVKFGGTGITVYLLVLVLT